MATMESKLREIRAGKGEKSISMMLGSTKRRLQSVIVNNERNGLGLQVIGGLAEEEGDKDYGIFIRTVLKGGVIESTGALLEGDQVMAVNGQMLLGLTNQEAVDWLRDASTGEFVEFCISRDKKAKNDFAELLDNYTYYNTNYFDDIHIPLRTSKGKAGRTTEGRNNSSPSTPKRPPQKKTRKNSTTSVSRSRSTSRNKEKSGKQDKSSHNIKGSKSRTSKPAAARSSGSKSVKDTKSQENQRVRSKEHVSKHKEKSVKPKKSKRSGDAFAASPTTSSKDSSARNPSQELLVSRLLHSLGVNTSSADLHVAPSKRLALDHNIRFPLYRLEAALGVMGLEVTPEGRASLRHGLDIDHHGCVNYADFIEAAKNVILNKTSSQDLRFGSLGQRSSDLRIKSNHLDLTYPREGLPSARELLHTTSDTELQELAGESARDANSDLLWHKNSQLQKEVHRLKMELMSKDKENQTAAAIISAIKSKTDLSSTHDDAHSFMACAQMTSNGNQPLLPRSQHSDPMSRSPHAMLSGLQLVDPITRGSPIGSPTVRTPQMMMSGQHIMEQDLNSASAHAMVKPSRSFKMSDTNIAKLIKGSLSKGKLTDPDIQQRFAILACQLRKAEEHKKNFKAAAHKLLELAEMVQAVLNSELQKSRHQLSLSQLHILETKVHSSIVTTREFMEVEELPFGWEEAYTPTGLKYFINHLSQTTTWQHPDNLNPATQTNPIPEYQEQEVAERSSFTSRYIN